MHFLKAVCFLNSFWGMITNYFILMLRKARSWSTLFMANLLGFILGLSLVELILMQFFNLYQTNESTWQPALALALIVLSLVTINYANFTTMQLKNRFRESGLRKLLGATNKQVATQHLLESIMIVIVAVLLSMILTEVAHPWFNQLFNMSFSLREHSMSAQLLMAIFFIGFVGIVGSVYPIWNFARITMKDIINHLKNAN